MTIFSNSLNKMTTMKKYILFLLLLIPSLILGEENFMFISIPKCGTNLLSGVLQDMTGLAWGLPDEKDIELEVEKACQNKKMLFSHRVTPPSIEFLLSKNYKFIFLYRDPRDQLISFIFWMKKMAPNHLISKFSDVNDQIHAMLTEKIKITQSFTMSTDEDELSHEYWFNVFYDQVADIPPQSIYRVRFEDIIGSRGGGSDEIQLSTILSIAKFLDIPLSEEKAKNIIDKRWGYSGTFRNGQIGDWKNYFNSEHIQLYKQNYGNLLINLNYERDLDW